jgi:Domain of unknown function (DUF4232)
MRQNRIRGIAITIGCMLAACNAQAGSNRSLYFPQSETAVVASKATDQPNYPATVDARPSAIVTAKPPAGILPCDTANLTATAVSEGATSAIAFSILITNQGSTSCKLQGWPQIQIVDQQGQPLVLQAIPFCFECGAPDNPSATLTPGEQATEPPVATATEQAIMQTPVILAPGENARLFLIWRNWCPPFPNGGVNLLMTLSGGVGELTIPTDAHTGARCDVPNAGSTLSISQFLH